MLTAQGFQRKRYEDYLAEMQEQARIEFGANVNLSDRSKLGKLIKLWAYERAETAELIEDVYNSGYMDSANGVSLHKLGKNVGIGPKGAQYSTGALHIAVEPGAVVSAGLIGKTEGGVLFQTEESVQDSDKDGVVAVAIKAVEPGASGNVPAGTIKVIVTPMDGVLSITNPEPTQHGQDAETDDKFRDRWDISVAKGGASTTDGIRATLIDEVPGLRAAIVIENDDEVVDADGRPPHSFECVVLGGQPEDIASVILKAKPGGIRAYGSQMQVVKDKSGQDKKIGFSYAAEKAIWVKINVAKTASFPTDGADVLKLEVIKYIGGQDQTHTAYSGLSMGDDVIHAKVVATAFGIPGVKNAVVTISTNGIDYTAADVGISTMEVAQTSWDKVVVTVV
ncbi:putative phage protein gp47/JayE [Brevibacillus sp. AG162]|uniref:baseplate J/gp47 family protein n=1 Tax=Brevibacillus sp. AG162 TaxID=2572910 RepID=UPI0011521257|nr:baseplate J/gp47 family protein [Brevibacillus sp. AG162]TQK41977.1 putative phage protein gp47/JayE [Brevibacillus sp. AG162]